MGKTRAEDEEPEEEQELPRPINLGDNLTIKRMLDEATAVVIDDLGYPPDYKLSNIELFWGVNAVLIAPLAHFYPLPFPESRTILFICCVCYFICYGILQAINAVYEKDYIVFTLPKPNIEGKSGYGLAIRTNLPRFDDNFVLTLEQRGEGGQTDSMEKSITAWFDADGYFHEHKFAEDVKAKIKELETSRSKKSN